MPRKVRMHLGGAGGGDGTGAGDELMPISLRKQEFGRRVYRRMHEQGMIASELARRAGLPRDSISTYVNGRSLPTPANLEKLAKALGVEPVELLPNHTRDAISASIPRFRMEISSNDQHLSWVHVDQLVTTETAVKIADLLRTDNAVDRVRSGTKA